MLLTVLLRLSNVGGTRFPFTRKIPKISHGAYIFQRPFSRGLYTERTLLFNIDRASLQLEGNLPFLLCFTLYLRAISTSTKPLGGLQSEGRFHSSFFVLRVCGGLYCLERLIRGGA